MQLSGFPAHVLAKTNNAQQAQITPVNRPTYFSASKGSVFIDEMHDNHLLNAIRKVAVIDADTIHQGNIISELSPERLVSTLDILFDLEVLEASNLLKNLYAEAVQRGLTK